MNDLYNPNTILIVSGNGRCGTTFLQSVLARKYNLDNLEEPFIDKNNKQSSLLTIASRSNWICKMFIQPKNLELSLQEIMVLSPKLIYDCYREKKLEQYLSFQIAVLNKKWNNNKKLNYKQITIDNPEISIKEFWKVEQAHKEVIRRLKDSNNVISISYEKMLIKYVDDITPSDSVKQTDMFEKYSLVSNIDVVLSVWNDLL